MKILNWTIVRSEKLGALVAQKDREIETTKQLLKEYQHQVKTLREFHQEEKLKEVIDVDIGDPTPENPDMRKMYVGRVAGFYKDILHAKCLQMISVFHKLLEEETNDKETDLYLKIGIFICREWMKWGDAAVSEQIGYQTDEPLTRDEAKEEIITQIKL